MAKNITVPYVSVSDFDWGLNLEASASLPWNPTIWYATHKSYPQHISTICLSNVKETKVPSRSLNRTPTLDDPGTHRLSALRLPALVGALLLRRPNHSMEHLPARNRFLAVLLRPVL
ncbi:hypothetical protein TMatcc_005327 [Talaromyces marneffei ATCC 18224]